MKIQLASDLHLEFLSPAQEVQLMEGFKGRADVLFLAGDILPLRFVDQVRDGLKQFCERYEFVVYVPGNHEYYNCSVKDAELVLGAVQNELSNLYVPRNQLMRIGKLKVYGGTMWFPDLLGNDILKPMLNDFHLISGFEPWVYEQCRQFTDHFEQRVDEDTIVLSHHLPSYESVPPKYQTEANVASLNRFFVHDMEQLMVEKSPKLWMHGHTHNPADYAIGLTRVLCNPLGYPGEGMPTFDPNLIVEI